MSYNEKWLFPKLKLFQSKLNALEVETELVERKNNKTAEGTEYPPVLFGELIVDEGFRTICVYGHVDSSTINEDDTKKDGGLGGKGALLSWLMALKVYSATKNEVPVNVKFIVEGLAESSSPTLQDVLSRKKEFFIDVDYVCLAIDKKIVETPCLRYGYRGVCHFSLDINCAENDIDSEKYAGAFDQPLMDAVHLVSSLMDKHDKLAAPNLMKDVVGPSMQEEEAIKNMNVNTEDLKRKIGVRKLRHKGIESRIVIHNSRLPSVSIHSFETKTNHTDPHNFTMIPCRTIVKFSISLVKNQIAADTHAQVESHIKQVWDRMKKVNEYQLKMDKGIDPWKEEPTHSNYRAAAEAIKSIYQQEPLYVCDGRSFPAVPILKSASYPCNMLVLSLSEPGGSVPIESLLKNVKVIMTYMCNVNEL
ncbi:cytosolic non-specific dipeptidase-like [Venturia canescens]|uniref:cytosolic non-specific dipeptidase-like n=1 Tax=Venturia canescens TaxID=32260 RepID=UPI001C9C1C2D|nr:cytosolic non-specific dipeptidase-like [Venturia canescens]